MQSSAAMPYVILKPLLRLEGDETRRVVSASCSGWLPRKSSLTLSFLCPVCVHYGGTVAVNLG